MLRSSHCCPTNSTRTSSGRRSTFPPPGRGSQIRLGRRGHRIATSCAPELNGLGRTNACGESTRRLGGSDPAIRYRYRTRKSNRPLRSGGPLQRRPAVTAAAGRFLLIRLAERKAASWCCSPAYLSDAPCQVRGKGSIVVGASPPDLDSGSGGQIATASGDRL